MKKGFTLVEVLAIIVIITVILLMAVPSYTGIISVIHQKVYDAKIKEVLAKSEIYASDSSKIVFDIKALIEQGLLEPDNELGEFKDPRNDRDMACDIVNVLFRENQYVSTITEGDTCYSNEDLNAMHGIAILRLVDQEGNVIPSIPNTDWLKRKEVYVEYELKEQYKEYAPYIEEILWYGESEKKCSQDNLDNCRYLVTTNTVLQSRVNFLIRINMSGTILQNETSKNVLLDNVAPIVSSIRFVDDVLVSANSERKVEFELSDGDGSGVKEFGISSSLSCDSVDYQEVQSGIETLYLKNGEYYICARDKVYNETDSEDAESRKITITNVDKNKPTIESIHITSTAIGYNNLNPKATIKAYDEGNTENTEGLKMCVSTTNYLTNCEWVPFQPIIDLSFDGDYDGLERTVYVSIQDASGNLAEKKEKYRVYKYCDSTTNFVEIGNTSSSCPKCGDAKFERTLQNKDQFFGNACKTMKEKEQCNIPRECCSHKVVSHYIWKSCSVSCGGGTQVGDTYYVSGYDNTVSCGSTVNSATQSCNTHSCIEYRSRNVVAATSNTITKESTMESVYSCICTSGVAYLPNSNDPFKCPKYNTYGSGCNNLTQSESRNVKCNPATKEGYGGGKCIQYMEVYGNKFCVQWGNQQVPNVPVCTPSMTSTCPSGYTLQYPLCVKTTYSCPSGYSLSGTTCYGPWSAWSSTPISSSSNVEVETRKP